MKLENNWRNKTLELLEKDVWPATAYESSLIERCYELRKKTLNDFTIDDLRVMIGQQIGLFYLLPLVIEKLNENLFAEGNFYEGDLLQSVGRIDSAFWAANKQYWQSINALIENKKAELEERKIDMAGFY